MRNSEHVAFDHSAQVLDSYFDTPAARDTARGAETTQKAAQQASQTLGNGSQVECLPVAQKSILQSVTTACEPLRMTVVTPAGSEQSTDSPRKTEVSLSGDAKSDATCARDPNSVTSSSGCPPELAAVIAASFARRWRPLGLRHRPSAAARNRATAGGGGGRQAQGM